MSRRSWKVGWLRRTAHSIRHSGTMPDVVTVYREGILAAATGPDGRVRTPELRRQIRITILHELAHHHGLNEEELTKGAIPYEAGIARYKEIARGQLLGDDTGMMKILIQPENRLILGVHIIGAGATELIHIGQAVMAFDGRIDYFINNVFNYPTLAECYKVAALDGVNKLRS